MQSTSGKDRVTKILAIACQVCERAHSKVDVITCFPYKFRPRNRTKL